MKRSFGLAALLIGLMHVAGAQAQVEYVLGPDGTWQPRAAPAPGTDESAIAEARRLIAQEKPEEAEELLDEWLDNNRYTASPYLPDAYLLRGDARLAQDREFRALYDYEAVIKSYPGSDAFVSAVEREVDIGVRYLNGLRRRFLGMRIDDATRIGEELLIRAQERMPRSALAERAAIELADYYYRERELRLAAEMYEIFLKNYPDSRHRERAMKRRVFASVARFKGPNYNPAPLLEARVLIEEYSRRYPVEAAAAGLSDAMYVRVDESAASEMLQTARWYADRGDPVSARLTLSRLLHKHARSESAAQAERFAAERGWSLQKPSRLAGRGAQR